MFASGSDFSDFRLIVWKLPKKTCFNSTILIIHSNLPKIHSEISLIQCNGLIHYVQYLYGYRFAIDSSFVRLLIWTSNLQYVGFNNYKSKSANFLCKNKFGNKTIFIFLLKDSIDNDKIFCPVRRTFYEFLKASEFIERDFISKPTLCGIRRKWN